jgi:hypothetical protein
MILNGKDLLRKEIDRWIKIFSSMPFGKPFCMIGTI